VLDFWQVAAPVENRDFQPAYAMVVGVDHADGNADIVATADEERWNADALWLDAYCLVRYVRDDVLADGGVSLESVLLSINRNLHECNVRRRPAAVVADVGHPLHAGFEADISHGVCAISHRRAKPVRIERAGVGDGSVHCVENELADLVPLEVHPGGEHTSQRAAKGHALAHARLIETSGAKTRNWRASGSSTRIQTSALNPMFRAREARCSSEKFTFHSSRMRMRRVSPEQLAAMNAEGIRCATELADARVDVMSTACLVPIMVQGPGYHRSVEEDMRRAVSDAGAASKVMTSAGALIYGLKKIGARKISLLAPYIKPLTEKVVAYIESEGVEVVDRICFEIADNLEVGRRDPMQLAEDLKGLNTANVDAVVLSACVQMQSLPAIESVERSLGIPVTSTSVCTVRNMLDLLGLEPFVPNAGRALARPELSASASWPPVLA
jgi:maleate isomerase